MPNLNYVAIIVAAVAGFAVGGLWYSPLLFANAWMRENKFSAEDVRRNFNPAKQYGVALAASIVASYFMALILTGPPHDPTLLSGAKRGLAAGFCWVAMAFLVSYSFEQRSMKLWAINGGYHTVQFTVMGAILGVMGT